MKKDCHLDVFDVLGIVNNILSHRLMFGEEIMLSDFNNSGRYDVLDALLLVDYILQQP